MNVNLIFVRLIQEEKQHAEIRAEELESRVKQRLPLNSYATLSSPPISGRITPKQMQHAPGPPSFVKYNTLPPNASLSQYYQYNSVGPVPSQVRKLNDVFCLDTVVLFVSFLAVRSSSG